MEIEKIVRDDEDESVCTASTASSTLSSIQCQPYRYKYSSEMVDILFKFARDNMESDKHDFEEAWKEFIKEEKIDNIIKRETELLSTSGYVGSISTKMYKSVRYYFMKKARMEETTNRIRMMHQKEKKEKKEKKEQVNVVTPANEEGNEKKRKIITSVDDPAGLKKRAYYKINKDILSLMDNFIKSEINDAVKAEDKEEEKEDEEEEEEEDIEDDTDKTKPDKTLSNKDRLKPSVMYENFREKYESILSKERHRMTKEWYPHELVITKIKKTFKNRCYTIFSQSE